ncbi:MULTISPECIES: K+/H+ antiporter subunit F [unclassified Guyparkeria]|uniref:K+/H+ antiporter subunit F n=1 Tax=unclassified Guyparkeria TaxID=2626246 RepID=UPI00073373EA|nr:MULTISPECIES: K+/H+ antiporter subunit F [unclassified Guyparkeria]KTG17574.1 cation:proton antiporter [Guyparkeria sp. XI15]OAE88387.1 cation:proton antiporter [Guyparkeria sp. WRN-7]
MIHVSLGIALVLIVIAMGLATYRLLKGPETADRVLALDTMSINAIALLIALGIWFETSINFEAALLIAVLGFITTVALSKYLIRGDIVE